MRRTHAVVLVLLLLLAACVSPAGPVPTPQTVSGVWFVEVEREDGVWLAPQTLHELGIDPSALRISRADHDIPFLPVQTDDGWGVFFFAPSFPTRYTRRTTFLLQAGENGETLPPVPPPPSGTTALPGGWAGVHTGLELRYLPQAATSIPWMWEPLYAPASVTRTVALTGALPGPITATLHLWSHTNLPPAPDHRLHLIWDGRRVGEWEWDGEGMQHLVAVWEEDEPAGEHTLVIQAPALAGVDVAVSWLDGWDLTYLRAPEAGGPPLRAAGAALQLPGLEPGMRLLDVTDPYAPLDHGALDATDQAPTVTTVPGHRYWLGVPEQAPGPLAVRPTRALDRGALQGTTYLVVAPPAFHGALQPLLEQRRAQGLSVALVDPQAIYDALGDGRPHPAAIRALVQELPTLRYLLVVGDGSLEPDGYDGEAGALRVVVPLTRTAILGETPADALLGVDAQGQPAVAVGRFPAATGREVAAMVEKTLRWEDVQELPAALLAYDGDEATFAELSGELAPYVPGSDARSVSAGQAGGREELLDVLDRGTVWLNYVGHGSLTRLDDQGLLLLEDEWREPALVVAWTCLAGHFVHPLQDSIGETWLRAPRGGAVAFLGPVGETTTGEQTPFARAFYSALEEETRLGDAWLAALQAGGSEDVMWGYVLLGDPALQISLGP